MKGTDPIQPLLVRNVQTLTGEELVSQAANLIRNTDLHSVIVTDKKGGFQGVITERMITRGYITMNTKVRSVMRRVPLLAPNSTLIEAANIALKAGIRQIPVYDGKNLEGMIVIDHVIREIDDPSLEEITLASIMSTNPIMVSPEASIAQVLALTREQSISRIPVVSKESLVGIVTLHDIVTKALFTSAHTRQPDVPVPNIKPLGNAIATIMTRNVISSEPEISVANAIKLMKKHNVSSLVVVDNNNVIGLVTRKDILQVIARQDLKIISPMTVQITFKTQPIELFEQEQINNFLQKFQDQYQDTIGSSNLTIYFKQHRSRDREIPLIQCRVRLITRFGQFIGVAENWGWFTPLQSALNSVERQLISRKEIISDHQQLKRFINKTVSPWD